MKMTELAGVGGLCCEPAEATAAGKIKASLSSLRMQQYRFLETE